MAYSLANISTANYWNRTATVEIIVGGWVVSFLRHSVVRTVQRGVPPCFETQNVLVYSYVSTELDF